MRIGNANKIKTDNLETIIGRNTEIHGDIKFRGGLHVDGKVKGNIKAENDSETFLILNQEGEIEGEVSVPNVVLNGQVKGDVHASGRVQLDKQARVEGNVYYNLLEMEMGSAINGNLVHQANKEKRLLEYQNKTQVSEEGKPDSK